MVVKFTEEQLLPIKEEIKKIKNNFNKHTRYNQYLAGNIEHEYKLEKSIKYLENLLLPYISEYDKKYDLYSHFRYANHQQEIILNDAWVNFQKKYEFNPMHSHSGILSFVIWIQVPYFVNDELYYQESSAPSGGAFQFSFVNHLGRMDSITIPVGKEKENNMLLFPSNFVHQVYPFYNTNGYRISVSGNFYLAKI